ncbi:MAG: STAS domain-containing protein [Lachnospiraceae bacterium]|nr:STAS domain-containing protein [Lachnospiraceae bacterium]
MTIDETRDGSKIQLNVHGKIDAISSNEFQLAVLKAFQKGNSLIIDFSDVAYISSAGLRALTLGQKTAKSKGGSLVIVHVNDAVNEVFRVTGFNKILTIQ